MSAPMNLINMRLKLPWWQTYHLPINWVEFLQFLEYKPTFLIL
jgi:hypothetical protein